MEKKTNALRDSISFLVSMCLHGSAIAVIVLGPAYMPGVLNGNMNGSKSSNQLIADIGESTELVELTVADNKAPNNTVDDVNSVTDEKHIVKNNTNKNSETNNNATTTEIAKTNYQIDNPQKAKNEVKLAEKTKSPSQELPEKNEKLIAPVIVKKSAENQIKSTTSAVQSSATETPVLETQDAISINDKTTDETIVIEEPSADTLSANSISADTATAPAAETQTESELVANENLLPAQEVTPTEQQNVAQDIKQSEEKNIAQEDTKQIEPQTITQEVKQTDQQVTTQENHQDKVQEKSQLESKTAQANETNITKMDQSQTVAATNNTNPNSSALNSSVAASRSYLNLKQVNGNIPPSYTREMRLNRMEGRGELVCLVNANGQVTNMKVLKSTGHATLDKAALDAFSKYKFQPNQQGYTRFPFEFTLKGPAISDHSRLRTTSR